MATGYESERDGKRARPAKSLTKTSTSQTVQKEIMNDSALVGGVGGASSAPSCQNKNQKMITKGSRLNAALRITFAVILTAPLALLVDIALLDMSWPMQVMISAANKALIVPLAMLMMDSIMGSPSVDGGVGTSIVNQGGLPTISKQAAIEVIAGQGA